jgi:hypothetical protein
LVDRISPFFSNTSSAILAAAAAPQTPPLSRTSTSPSLANQYELIDDTNAQGATGESEQETSGDEAALLEQTKASLRVHVTTHKPSDEWADLLSVDRLYMFKQHYIVKFETPYIRSLQGVLRQIQGRLQQRKTETEAWKTLTEVQNRTGGKYQKNALKF